MNKDVVCLHNMPLILKNRLLSKIYKRDGDSAEYLNIAEEVEALKKQNINNFLYFGGKVKQPEDPHALSKLLSDIQENCKDITISEFTKIIFCRELMDREERRISMMDTSFTQLNRNCKPFYECIENYSSELIFDIASEYNCILILLKALLQYTVTYRYYVAVNVQTEGTEGVFMNECYDIVRRCSKEFDMHPCYQLYNEFDLPEYYCDDIDGYYREQLYYVNQTPNLQHQMTEKVESLFDLCTEGRGEGVCNVDMTDVSFKNEVYEGELCRYMKEGVMRDGVPYLNDEERNKMNDGMYDCQHMREHNKLNESFDKVERMKAERISRPSKARIYLHKKGYFRVVWWEGKYGSRQRREKVFAATNYGELQAAEDAGYRFAEHVDNQLRSQYYLSDYGTTDTAVPITRTEVEYEGVGSTAIPKEAAMIQWYSGMVIPLGNVGRAVLKKALAEKRNHDPSLCDDLLFRNNLKIPKLSSFGYYTLQELLHAANVLGLWPLVQKLCLDGCRRRGFRVEWLAEMRTRGVATTYHNLKSKKFKEIRYQTYAKKKVAAAKHLRGKESQRDTP